MKKFFVTLFTTVACVSTLAACENNSQQGNQSQPSKDGYKNLEAVNDTIATKKPIGSGYQQRC